MASKTVNIGKLTRGTDVTLKFEIKTSVDLSSARFIVKKRIKDADADAIVNKLITTTLSASGQITDPRGADDLAIALVFLSRSDSMLFKAEFDYQYDFEVFDPASKSTVPVGGTITYGERVRRGTG